jgi:hypothetical protein
MFTMTKQQMYQESIGHGRQPVGLNGYFDLHYSSHSASFSSSTPGQRAASGLHGVAGDLETENQRDWS